MYFNNYVVMFIAKTNTSFYLKFLKVRAKDDNIEQYNALLDIFAKLNRTILCLRCEIPL